MAKVKKTQADWDRELEETILELIKEFKINKNDEDDFAQEVRIYSFLNMDRAAHKSIFIYKLKRGVGIQKIIDKFTTPDLADYLEDNLMEEYSMFPEVYRHEIMEIVLELVSDTKKYFSQRDVYIPYASRRVKLANRNMEIFLRYIMYDETYVAIAKDYNLSTERVRGIIAKYMRFLRHPMYSKRLYAYHLDDLR